MRLDLWVKVYNQAVFRHCGCIRTGLIVITCLLNPLRARGQQEDRAARLHQAFDVIDKGVQSSSVPGLAVGIKDRTGTLKIFTHGYADIKTKTPITADTLF